MDTDIYKKVERFVVGVFAKAGKPADAFHAQRTAYWAKKLKPKASKELLIAALAHDIERAFYGDWKKGSSDPDDLRKHQDLSAREIEKFLQKEKAEKSFIEKVKVLVAHHEEGGDEEQNALCDADCLAYFEEKAGRLAETFAQRGKTKDEVEKILSYVFNRITSRPAQKIARPFYEKAIKVLMAK